MKIFFMIIVTVLGMTVVNASQRANPVVVVQNVDLTKFLGQWYEIAVIPYFWERGCVATNATYTLRADGRIDVLNKCNDKTLNGKLKTAHGVAVADPKENAKLKVSFFEPFFAKYWIIDLGQNYEYAVTASPDHRYLWILSRTTHMDPQVYKTILEKVSEQGFDITKLVKTLQP